MFDVSTKLRLPAFLEGVNVDRKVEAAGFLAEHSRALAGVAANDVRVGGAAPATIPGVDDLIELVDPAAMATIGVGAPAPAAPAPPPPPVIDYSRLEAAVDRLRLLSERLASEARSDALELGLMIARKVVEGELAVNADRLINVVKSAVSRVGESRRIVVHLAPEDAELFNGGREAAAGEPTATAAMERIARGAAKVEVVADASLSRGDCLVEGEHLSVDARLDAKFAEIRRALLESAWEETP